MQNRSLPYRLLAVERLLQSRNAPSLVGDSADQRKLIAFALHAQKRSRMALGKPVFAQRLQNRRRMPQQPQLICNGALTFAELARCLRLAQAILLHQQGDASCLVDVVQLLLPQGFNKRVSSAAEIIVRTHDAGHLSKPCDSRGAKPTLACHQRIPSVSTPNGERLQDPVARNGIRKRAERLRIIPPPRLRRIRINFGNRQKNDLPRGTLRLPHCLTPSPRLLYRTLFAKSGEKRR